MIYQVPFPQEAIFCGKGPGRCREATTGDGYETARCAVIRSSSDVQVYAPAESSAGRSYRITREVPRLNTAWNLASARIPIAGILTSRSGKVRSRAPGSACSRCLRTRSPSESRITGQNGELRRTGEETSPRPQTWRAAASVICDLTCAGSMASTSPGRNTRNGSVVRMGTARSAGSQRKASTRISTMITIPVGLGISCAASATRVSAVSRTILNCSGRRLSTSNVTG